MNTLENAFSAKTAVGEGKYSSVILVTSDYHIPRAHLAFRKVLPPDVVALRDPGRSGGRPGRLLAVGEAALPRGVEILGIPDPPPVGVRDQASGLRREKSGIFSASFVDTFLPSTVSLPSRNSRIAIG